MWSCVAAAAGTTSMCLLDAVVLALMCHCSLCMKLVVSVNLVILLAVVSVYDVAMWQFQTTSRTVYDITVLWLMPDILVIHRAFSNLFGSCHTLMHFHLCFFFLLASWSLCCTSWILIFLSGSSGWFLV